jgi:hypothetical protein
MIFWVTGMFGWVIGLGAGINLSHLSACLLAAISFYFVVDRPRLFNESSPEQNERTSTSTISHETS